MIFGSILFEFIDKIPLCRVMLYKLTVQFCLSKKPPPLPNMNEKKKKTVRKNRNKFKLEINIAWHIVLSPLLIRIRLIQKLRG